MFTTVAYDQSVDTSAVLTLHNAVPDPHVRINGADVIVPALNKIVFLLASGANITLAQMQSPSLRAKTLYDLFPLNRAALPPSIPPFIDLTAEPIELAVNEALDFAAAEDAVGAARQIGIVGLGDAAYALPGGPIETVRVTATTTLVVDTWTNGALTFGQVLRAGTYAVVGAQFFSTNLLAFRLVFPGYPWRPGGIGNQAVNHIAPMKQRMGGWGVWGTFMHNTPPTVDFLASVADAAETGFLDLIKIA